MLALVLERLRPRHHEEGQGLAEYALILAGIAILAIVAVTFFGQQLADLMSTIGSRVEDAAS